MSVKQVGIVDREFLRSERAYPKESFIGKVLTCIYQFFFKMNYFFYSLFSKDSALNDLKIKLSKNRIIELKKCAKKYSNIDISDAKDLNHSNLTHSQIDYFISKVIYVKELIEKDEGDISKLPKLSNKIRDAIEAPLASPVYKANKFKDHPAINFLQELSYSIHIRSKGAGEISCFAHKFFIPNKSSYSFKDIASLLDKTVEEETGMIHRNSKKATTVWFILHPLKGLNALLANFTPLDARPHDTNNNEIAVHNFNLGNIKARFYHGPNPAVGRIFCAHLDYLKKQDKFLHLHHNLQHLSKKGEDIRIYKLLRKEDKYKDVFRLYSTPMDGRAWEARDPRFLAFKSPEEFYLIYAKYAIANDLGAPGDSIDEIPGETYKYHEIDKNADNGFYIGRDVLTDLQFKEAFKLSSQAMKKVYANGRNSFWKELSQTEEGKKRLSKMMQVSTQGFISIGAILKLLHDVKDQKQRGRVIDAVVSQSCKQDIDRGVALNIITRLYYHLLTHQTLTKRDVQIIIGTVIARAKLVENRVILFERFEPLSDLLHFIGSNEDAIKSSLMQFSHKIKTDKQSYMSKAVSFVHPFSSDQHYVEILS